MFTDLFSTEGLYELFDWRVFVYVVVSIVLLVVAKFANGLLGGYALDRELTEKDNKSVAVSLGGFVIALCLIIHGVMTSPPDASVAEDATWVNDLVNTSIWVSIGCLLLLLNRLIADKILLPRFSNKRELVEDRNVGVGFVQAGSYVATALVIRATVGSEGSGTFIEELGLTGIWFVASQVLLLAYGFLYQRVTRYDMHEELRTENHGVGVAFAGNVIAYGMLIGYYVNNYDSLLGLLCWAGVAAGMLFIIRVGTDKLLLPGRKLDDELAEDKNWGAGVIEACVAIGAAFIITGAFA